jgi:hypothetical protein
VVVKGEHREHKILLTVEFPGLKKCLADRRHSINIYRKSRKGWGPNRDCGAETGLGKHENSDERGLIHPEGSEYLRRQDQGVHQLLLGHHFAPSKTRCSPLPSPTPCRLKLRFLLAPQDFSRSM